MNAFVRTFRPAGGLRARHLILMTLAAAALVAVVVLLGSKLDWKELQRALERLDPGWLLAAMAFLPLLGFSIGLVYLIAGAKFGPWVGTAVVTGVTAVHLLAAQWIARGFLRRWVERVVRRRGHQLPAIAPGAEAAVAAIGALVPGPPYFVRLYLLALSGVRLRVLLLVCLPIYVVRSGLVIFLGDFDGDWSARGMAIVAGIFALKVAICALLLRQLRRRYVLTPSTANGLVSGEQKKAPDASPALKG